MAEISQIRERNPHTDYEREDWPLKPIALIYLGTFVLLVIAPLVLLWAYPQSVSDVSRRLEIRPPAPELQVNPQQDLIRFRLSEDNKLNNYYWVDKQKGIVHIPIEQAMKKLVAQGTDGFPKGQP